MQVNSVWQTWNTSSIGGNGIDYWSDVVTRGVIDAEMEPTGRGRFDGMLSSRTAGPGRFVNFRTHPHGVSRTVNQAGRGDGHIMVGLQCRGESLMDQGGVRVRLRPGQIALIDSNAPFHLLFPEIVERRLVLLPRNLFARFQRHTSLTAQPLIVSTDTGSAALARDAILRLTDIEQQWDDDDCTAMTEALVSLIDRAVAPRASTSSGSNNSRIARIKSLIEDRLSNRSLDPALIARDAGLSVRSLHRAFAEQGKTFSRVLLDLRLDHARALIEREDDLPLISVALASGFADPAHFSRNYRTQFGETPSATRARRRSK